MTACVSTKEGALKLVMIDLDYINLLDGDLDMALKNQLLNILEQGMESKRTFVANLTDEQKEYAGTYEKWSAKDILAHMSYWKDLRGSRYTALAYGEELQPLPNFEQGNVECFKRFSDSSWDEVQAFADLSHAQYVEAVLGLDEEVLAGPSTESEERKMWEEIVGTGYNHPLFHISKFYIDHGQQKKASLLWSDWGKLVSPLDDSPDWQGRVHYNLACSLALSGNADQAIAELRQALELRPSMRAWSRQDSDLSILHNQQEYKELFAPTYWWKAIEANPQAEALSDQFIRTLAMLRYAIEAFSPEEWRKGDTLYQRPAGLSLHIVEAIDSYSALEPGEFTEDEIVSISWEDKDSSKLPSQERLLAYLDKVEDKLARFIANADLEAEEEMFPWTGSTMLSRALYTLRHIQHHLADIGMELHIRGLKAPDWQ